MTTTEIIESRLRKLGDPERAAHHLRFFKTAPGEYGEGDRFFGVRVPRVRGLVREFRGLPLEEIRDLLDSPWHEARLFALLSMVEIYSWGGPEVREGVFQMYTTHTRCINNWDLVDCSAPGIVGAHLWERPRTLLTGFAGSPCLWERRIAVIATLYFIRRGDFADTLNISSLLLGDREDLIHKAVGWMLREVGNRDRAAEEVFLVKHYRDMPRTMLRYAIEKFPEPRRQQYLKGRVRGIQAEPGGGA